MKVIFVSAVLIEVVVAAFAFPNPTGDRIFAKLTRRARSPGDAPSRYQALGTDKVGAGGAAVSKDGMKSLNPKQWMDADNWEKNHEEQWGGFENYQERWQNWAQDSNSGNYKLANKGVGAFDNGEFNAEKASEEFFGPDHVKNDWKFGNYTTNAGFGIGKQINTGENGGKGDNGTDGKGGFWGKLHCRIHSSMFLNKKHLRLPIPCSLTL